MYRDSSNLYEEKYNKTYLKSKWFVVDKTFIGTYPISCSIKPPLLLVPVGGGVSVPVGSPHGVRRRIVHHNVSYPIISQKKLAELADSTITLPKVGSTIKVRRNWNPSMKKGAKVRYAFLY